MKLIIKEDTEVNNLMKSIYLFLANNIYNDEMTMGASLAKVITTTLKKGNTYGDFNGDLVLKYFIKHLPRSI